MTRPHLGRNARPMTRVLLERVPTRTVMPACGTAMCGDRRIVITARAFHLPALVIDP